MKTYPQAPWCTVPLNITGILTKTDRIIKPERCPTTSIYVDEAGEKFVKIKGYWYRADSVNA